MEAKYVVYFNFYYFLINPIIHLHCTSLESSSIRKTTSITETNFDKYLKYEEAFLRLINVRRFLALSKKQTKTRKWLKLAKCIM